MKKELDEALVRDFPLCFASDPQGREPWSMFGFECSDGWEPSIRKAAEKLEVLIRAANENDPHTDNFVYCKTIQLKEKFGTGRWYLSGGTDEMDNIVAEWEDATHTICETCGQPGKLRGHGWYYTACWDHTKLEDRDSLEIVEKASEEKERTNG